MEMRRVESSNIKAVGYDPATKRLRVEFGSGSTYEYSGVSATTHEGLVGAESVGKYFHRHVRGAHKGKAVESDG